MYVSKIKEQDPLFSSFPKSANLRPLKGSPFWRPKLVRFRRLEPGFWLQFVLEHNNWQPAKVPIDVLKRERPVSQK